MDVADDGQRTSSIDELPIRTCEFAAISAVQMQGMMIAASPRTSIRRAHVYCCYSQVWRLRDCRLGVVAGRLFVVMAGDHRQRLLACASPFENDCIGIHALGPLA
jgi:hypothetical protein